MSRVWNELAEVLRGRKPRAVAGAAGVSADELPGMKRDILALAEGAPMMPVIPGPVTDYRIEGPEEARQLVRDNRACETAPNGTGSQCLCGFDCANYWLRSRGYKAG